VLTVLRRHGEQLQFDIVEIANELTLHHGDDGSLSVLFEWSQVSSWTFEAPGAGALLEWKKTAPPISRAALVHSQKLTRHAAILAALMRVSGAEVRSFRTPECDRAVEWLAQGLFSPSLDQRRTAGKS
jgi:hypothetical protein